MLELHRAIFSEIKGSIISEDVERGIFQKSLGSWCAFSIKQRSSILLPNIEGIKHSYWAGMNPNNGNLTSTQPTGHTPVKYTATSGNGTAPSLSTGFRRNPVASLIRHYIHAGWFDHNSLVQSWATSKYFLPCLALVSVSCLWPRIVVKFQLSYWDLICWTLKAGPGVASSLVRCIKSRLLERG